MRNHYIFAAVDENEDIYFETISYSEDGAKQHADDDGLNHAIKQLTVCDDYGELRAMCRMMAEALKPFADACCDLTLGESISDPCECNHCLAANVMALYDEMITADEQKGG